MFPIEFHHATSMDDMIALYRVLMKEYPPTARMTDAQINKVRRLSLAVSVLSALLAFVIYGLSPIAALLPAAMAIIFPFIAYFLPANAMKQQEAAWQRLVDHPYAEDLRQEHLHRIDDDGIFIEGPYTTAQFRWKIVKLTTQDDARTYFVWGLGNGLVVPHDKLPDNVTPQAFADACREKMNAPTDP